MTGLGTNLKLQLELFRQSITFFLLQKKEAHVDC